MRKTLTDKGVAALKPRPNRYAFPDPELRGHYVRVQPSGAKAFVTVARNPQGKQVWTHIAACDVMGIDEARKKARETIGRVRAGLPAVEASADSFGSVTGNWIKRHVEPGGLRSAPEIKRLLTRHVLTQWQDRAFISIRRSDVAALLDHVEDNHGARQADYVLNIVRSIMNWYSARNDDYASVILRGMRRQNPKAQARTRVLDDNEIRAIWKVAESAGTFGAIVRFALLTAQRRAKIVNLKFSDISEDGVWTIPKAPREKDSVGSVKLPPMALDIIKRQPRLGENPFVFAGRGNNCFCGFSKSKRRFDAKLQNVAPWTVHDCRRSARSLMSRAGVSSEHAEKIMGHVVPGVEGVYDRFQYDEAKATALARLAQLIDGILHHRDNVLPMKKKGKR
jgi:integrase